MHKYLQQTFDRLQQQANGMSNHADLWQNQPVNADLVKADAATLETTDSDLTTSEQQLSAKKKNARELSASLNEKADQNENLIKFIHKDDPDKWIEYGIAPKKTPEAGMSPTRPLTLTISDDTDGQGFIVRLTASDTDAKMYLWERGTSADPKATQPDSFVPLRETTKISIVDDDVLPGVRYFYHVRAFNNKGYGPWSNVVSKVQ
ncbi:MAG: fibronectin type III domain-containing protein [Ignavibacteriae bacterium]|nr:fibronectin type III domain-containing protein [Ignavibacteriota bacterium]